jgi:hypothetical protein
MDYNSNQAKLIFPEYGRNVQEMILVAKKETDPIRRQKLANAIVALMAQLSPAPKNSLDNRPRLWKHFFAIANYEIDVVSNEGIQYEPESNPIRPSTIEYPPSNETYRHYGNHIRKLIKTAVEMEDGPKKVYLISLIGSYMKMAYKTWSKDHYVTDEGILKDLVAISKGRLRVEDTSLDVLNRKGKGGNLQPATSEPKPFKHGKYKNKNRRFNNDRNRNHRRR